MRHATRLVRHFLTGSRGASTATGCRLKVATGIPYHDLRQNAVLGTLVEPKKPDTGSTFSPGRYFSQTMSSCFGMDAQQVPFGASTDFVSFLLGFPRLNV